MCLLIAHVLHRSIILSLSSRNGPGVPKLTLTVIFYKSTYRERCDGFACNVSISVSFPAPTSSIYLNSNNDKTYEVTPMIESLRTTQSITFLDCNAFRVSGRRRRRGMKNNRTRIRARENRLKPLLRTSSLGTRPSCLPSPGSRYSTETTKNRIYNWECPERGSPVKMMSDSTKNG